MTWFGFRRNQMLAGGLAGALSGGAVAHFADSGHALVPVVVGFALGQVVAVVAGSTLQPNKSPKRTNQSLLD